MLLGEGARRYMRRPAMRSVISTVPRREHGGLLRHYHFTRRSKNDGPARHYKPVYSAGTADTSSYRCPSARPSCFIVVAGRAEILDGPLEPVCLGRRNRPDGAGSPRSRKRQGEGVIPILGWKTNNSITSVRWLREPSACHETSYTFTKRPRRHPSSK
jgi:hypothetical protein